MKTLDLFLRKAPDDDLPPGWFVDELIDAWWVCPRAVRILFAVAIVSTLTGFLVGFYV